MIKIYLSMVVLFTNACINFTATKHAQIAKYMGPTWGPPGSSRPQMGPMLAPWTLLWGCFFIKGLMNEIDG